MLRITLLAAIVALVGADLVPCGMPVVAPVQNRIVGGVTAKPGSWPWMVLFVDARGYLMGSGFIVNQNVIVTAARLFEGEGFDITQINLYFWRVYAGEHDITVEDPNEQFYYIRRVALHPGYNTSSLENNVALVFTEDLIEYNDHTRPACLPVSGQPAAVGASCIMPGWGHTAGTGDDTVLNQVDYPVLEDEVCKGYYHDFIPDAEICAGHENGGKAFCWDDMGNPLMCKDAESGAWFAHGLAFGGGNCTAADQPGVFEDLTVYTEWIVTTMEEAGYPYEYL